MSVCWRWAVLVLCLARRPASLNCLIETISTSRAPMRSWLDAARSLAAQSPVLLLQRHATVTVCHSKTRDLPSVTRQADILIAAIGRPAFIRGDFIKPGAIVIDVGVNKITRPCNGPANFSATKQKRESKRSRRAATLLWAMFIRQKPMPLPANGRQCRVVLGCLPSRC